MDLTKLTLANSALTNTVYIGTAKNGIWKNKMDITNEFLDCAISRWQHKNEIVTLGPNKFK